MTVVDLHPEELLDKLERGELTDGDRERLGQHLSACATCRFEVAVRTDLAREPAARAPAPILFPPPGTAPAAGPPVRPRLRARKPFALLAIAAALVAGGALAGVASGVLTLGLGGSGTPPASEVKDVAGGEGRIAPMKRAARTAVASVEAAAERGSSETARTGEPAPPGRETATSAPGADTTAETAARGSAPEHEGAAAKDVAASGDVARDGTVAARSSARAPRTRRGASGVAAVSDGEARATERRSAEPDGVHAGAAPERAGGTSATSAGALFSSANGARRDGDASRAIELYRELLDWFPESPEASLSRATMAKLMLDRGDARGALRGFDEYIEHGDGALGEEALVGKARALGDLGRHAEEMAAWREVLRRFPGSVHARVARARLAAPDER